MARFVPAWEQGGPGSQIVRDIAGYRKRNDDGWDYFVTTSAWSDELCRGFDSQQLAAYMAARQWLATPSSGRHRARSVAVPGQTRLRLYHIPARFLADGADDSGPAGL
jgi:putative DNA primase/helicase